MRPRKTITALAAAAMLAACQPPTCHVTGTISGIADGDTLLLTIDTNLPSPSTLLPSQAYTHPSQADTIIVHNGSFTWETAADTARLCILQLHPHHETTTPHETTLHVVTFFAERGDVTINIRQQHTSFTSRVSGTPLNDEWQRLNDMASSYSQRISRTVSCLLSAGTPPSLVRRRVTELYKELEGNISDAAERNRDNELGRFIRTHHEGRELHK